MTPSHEDQCALDVGDRFELIAEIGHGTYGTVYRARDTAPVPPAATQPLVALKSMQLEARDEGVATTTLREVGLLSSLLEFHNAHIVRLREFFPSGGRMHMVFDLMDGDLHMWLKEHFAAGMPELLVRSCTAQILAGLDYIHSPMVSANTSSELSTSGPIPLSSITPCIAARARIPGASSLQLSNE